MDVVSKKSIEYDSIAVTRERDGKRLVSKVPWVNFGTVGIDDNATSSAGLSIVDDEIRCTGFEGPVSVEISDIHGRLMEMPTMPSGVDHIVPISSLAVGWYSIVATDGISVVRSAFTSSSLNSTRIVQTKQMEQVQATETYTFVLYQGSFISPKVYFYTDPLNPKRQDIYVARPRWMNRTLSVDVYDQFTSPSDRPTYHQDLYSGKSRSGYTYAWSFEKDSDTYVLHADGPTGKMVYVTGDEYRDATITFLTESRGYNVYTARLVDRPEIIGNTVVIKCSDSMPILHAYQELDGSNQLQPYSDQLCYGRRFVFTLK